jgi:hypothetical protein
MSGSGRWGSCGRSRGNGSGGGGRTGGVGVGVGGSGGNTASGSSGSLFSAAATAEDLLAVLDDAEEALVVTEPELVLAEGADPLVGFDEESRNGRGSELAMSCSSTPRRG